jgi:hypothetical protein
MNDKATYVPNVELIARVASATAEVVVRGRPWGRSSMQTLACHRHSNLPRDRGSTET